MSSVDDLEWILSFFNILIVSCDGGGVAFLGELMLHEVSPLAQSHLLKLFYESSAQKQRHR